MKLWIQTCADLHVISSRTLNNWVQQAKIKSYKYTLDRKTYVEEDEVVKVINGERAIHDYPFRLLWINQCANELHVDRTTIYKWIREGNVQQYKFTSDMHSYVNPEEVSKMIAVMGTPRKLLIRPEVRPRGQVEQMRSDRD